jgi:hypothetical protein
MFKRAGDLVTAAPEQRVVDESMARNVFKVLHGFYGNLFSSKYATGRAVEDGPCRGEDEGMVNARRIWAHGLSAFDVETVKAALRQCQQAHPEFPPSLPQLVMLCAANKPREAFTPPRAIGMSQALRSKYAAGARAILEKHAARAREREAGGRIELPEGLDGLKQAVADAVGCAGGDEAGTLARLDRELAPRTAA